MMVAGFGYRAGVSVATLQQLYDTARGVQTCDAIAALATKIHEPGLQELAARLAAEVVPVDSGQLQCIETVTSSVRIEQSFGTGSVAEALALIVAGPEAILWKKRIVSSDGMATCAIAKGVER